MACSGILGILTLCLGLSVLCGMSPIGSSSLSLSTGFSSTRGYLLIKWCVFHRYTLPSTCTVYDWWSWTFTITPFFHGRSSFNLIQTGSFITKFRVFGIFLWVSWLMYLSSYSVWTMPGLGRLVCSICSTCIWLFLYFYPCCMFLQNPTMIFTNNCTIYQFEREDVSIDVVHTMLRKK